MPALVPHQESQAQHHMVTDSVRGCTHRTCTTHGSACSLQQQQNNSKQLGLYNTNDKTELLMTSCLQGLIIIIMTSCHDVHAINATRVCAAVLPCGQQVSRQTACMMLLLECCCACVQQPAKTGRNYWCVVHTIKVSDNLSR
jgi:hypothetical protein